MPDIEKTISPEEANAALKKEREDRLAACSKDIAAVLSKHKCILDVVTIIKSGKIESSVVIDAQ